MAAFHVSVTDVAANVANATGGEPLDVAPVNTFLIWFRGHLLSLKAAVEAGAGACRVIQLRALSPPLLPHTSAADVPRV